MTHPIATRAQGLACMQAFAPRMGQHYAQGRNFDRGAGQHNDVSQLSPYLRHRLITEQEVVAAALAAQGPENAEKFVQEVLWRSYFKGWLERRPTIWADYRRGLVQDIAALQTDVDLQGRVNAATRGTTGIACFDAWAQELVQTGYLHNHARMWFASIWIFSLGLPWRLGADFFLRHLLDGDPASNTCSWRWVGGLHTRGKAYHAQAWNIAKFTGGRFAPTDADLEQRVDSLEHTEPEGLPEVTPLRPFTTPVANVPTLLVLTEDDCMPEDFDLTSLNIMGAIRLRAAHLRSSLPVSQDVLNFEQSALQDAATRIGLDTIEMRADGSAELATHAAKSGAHQIAMPYVPTGPLTDWVTAAKSDLTVQGITLTEWCRDWDKAVWPHTTAGFFKVKKKIPEILHQTGLS